MSGAAGDAALVEVDGRSVRITHPHKVLFPALGATKWDVIQYYLAVREPFLGAMQRRPTMLQRHPDGVGGPSFFQKRIPPSAPEWIETTVVTTPNGTASRALVIADMAHALWAVNLGCLGFHPWAYRADDPAHVDQLRVDLDPAPGLGFGAVRDAAAAVKVLLDEVGLTSYVKTSGSRGLHVYVPLEPRWDAVAVRAAAVALARAAELRHPDLITASWWKEERGPRVFVDYNQNAPHKTVFGAWSVRARVGAQVSTPVGWDELDDLDPDALTITSVPARVAARGDAWAGFDAHPQSLAPLLEVAAADWERGLPDAPWPPQYPKMPGEPPRVAPSRSRRTPPQE